MNGQDDEPSSTRRRKKRRRSHENEDQVGGDAANSGQAGAAQEAKRAMRLFLQTLSPEQRELAALVKLCDLDESGVPAIQESKQVRAEHAEQCNSQAAA